MPFDPDKITMNQIARNGGTLETREPRGRGRMPSFAQVVITPAVFVGLLFCGISFSGSLAAFAMYPDEPAIMAIQTPGLLAIAFAVGAGCLATLAIAGWQIGNWNSLQRGLKRVTLNPREPIREPQRARVISQTSPTSWEVSRHAWEGELPKMARKFHNQRGEWIAPDRLTRNQLTGIVKSLTESYPAIVSDLSSWGWLDDDNNWTDLGKMALRAKLSFMSATPARRPV
jgi:hypothetical protein